MSNQVISRVKESRQLVWDPIGGEWVAMQQPTLEADNVTIEGTITVQDGGGSLTVDASTWPLPTGAAGTAQPIYNVRIGTNATTADTARLTLTGPAQTAIADVGTLFILVTVRTAGASTVLQGAAWWGHRGTAANTTTSGTGFANDSTGHIEGTSAAFDSTAMAGNKIGISINGGTSAGWTITQCQVEAAW